MSGNFVEELVAEFYRINGFLVTKNYWFPFTTPRTRKVKGKGQTYNAQSWADIDVLALNEKELHIIQVKAIVNQPQTVSSILTFYDRACEFLQNGLAPDGKIDISWLIKNRNIRKILVYEWPSVPKYLNQIKEAKIEVKDFSEYLDKLLEYSNNKAGFKEENVLLRFVHYLNENEYFDEDEA